MRALLFALWLIASAAQAQNLEDSFLRYTYRLNGPEIKEFGVFSQRVPSFEEIERDQFRFKDYSQFISYLLWQAPTLKTHFILLHHSQSLQLASEEHPRVVLFDGGSMFAFAEHPENRALRVEILEMDPQTSEIRPREIVFEKQGIRFNRDPKACVSCHGRPLKPLWDPYDFWPNAFGAAVGNVHTQQEIDAYERLKANRPKSPLLSQLTFAPQITAGSEENTAFTQYIQQINLKQWMKRELSGRDLSSIRFPLLATVGACFSQFPRVTFEEQKAKVLELLPNISDRDRTNLDVIFEDVSNSRAHTKQFQDGLLTRYLPPSQIVRPIDHERLGHERNDIAVLRWLLDLGGVNGANLSASHMANDYLISSPAFFLLDTLMVLRDVRPDLFEGLRLTPIDLTTGRFAWLGVDCDELKTKSLQAVNLATSATERLWRTYRRDQPERPPVSRCAKCHTEGMSRRAPHIPFDDTLALARMLRSTDYADRILQRIDSAGVDQMPPETPLTTEENEAMREFIKALR